MDFEVKSAGKEKFLRKDFLVAAPCCKCQRRDSKWVYLPHIINASISVIACFIVCSGAIYSQKVLVEIKNIHLLIDKDLKLATEAIPRTGSSDISGEARTEGHRSVTLSSVEEQSEHYVGGAGFEDIDMNMDKSDQDVDEDGDEVDFGNFDEILGDGSEEMFTAEKVVRKRRSTQDEVRKCKRQCKGKGKKQCRKKCAANKQKKEVQYKTSLVEMNLRAAHFEGNMYNEIANRLVDTTYNRIKGPGEGPLKIFKQASWVDSSSPVSFDKDSSVSTALSAGIYLVYAQAYIGGHEPEKCISIVQKRSGVEQNALSCDNGASPSQSSRSQMQTCAVFGLMKLEKGDTVEIQRSAATVGLSLDKDKTFFGIVRLGGIATINL